MKQEPVVRTPVVDGPLWCKLLATWSQAWRMFLDQFPRSHVQCWLPRFLPTLQEGNLQGFGCPKFGHRRLPRCLMQKMQWNDHFIALFWLPRSVIWGANVVGLPSYETRQKTGASLGTVANDGIQCHTFMGPGPFDDRACPSIFKSWRVGWCHIPQEVWLARVERTWPNLRSESLRASASCMIVSLSFLGKKS